MTLYLPLYFGVIHLFKCLKAARVNKSRTVFAWDSFIVSTILDMFWFFANYFTKKLQSKATDAVATSAAYVSRSPLMKAGFLQVRWPLWRQTMSKKWRQVPRRLCRASKLNTCCVAFHNWQYYLSLWVTQFDGERWDAAMLCALWRVLCRFTQSRFVAHIQTQKVRTSSSRAEAIFNMVLYMLVTTVLQCPVWS